MICLEVLFKLKSLKNPIPLIITTVSTY